MDDLLSVDAPRSKTPAHDRARSRGGAWRFWRSDWVAIVALIVASLAVVVVHVPQHSLNSPFDEYVYIDYLHKVPTQFVVRQGEDTGTFARIYVACHGTRMVDFLPPDVCAQKKTADNIYPMNGLSSADIYSPVYFASTWALAQPLVLLGDVGLVNAGRYVGACWLALAAVFLYLTLRRLKVHRGLAVGLGLLLVGSLPAYWSNTYISTDAAGLAAGSVLVYLSFQVADSKRRAGLWFILASMAFTLIKVHNFSAVALTALFLVLTASVAAFREPGQTRARLARGVRDPRLVIGIVAGFAALIAQISWMSVRAAISLGPSANQGVATLITPTALVHEVLKFLPGVIDGGIDPARLGTSAFVIAAIGAWIVVAGVIGAVAVERTGSRTSLFAISTLIAVLTAAPALAIATRASAGFYFDLPVRYGIALIPALLVCAGTVFTRKTWVAMSLGGTGAALFLMSLRITG